MTPVSTFLASTCALAMTAPAGSEIVPVMVPWLDWENALNPINNVTTAAVKGRTPTSLLRTTEARAIITAEGARVDVAPVITNINGIDAAALCQPRERVHYFRAFFKGHEVAG